jgi:hypothetical protein
MASRYIRDTVILAKLETVYGTDIVPTGAANAMLVKNVRITPINADYVSRDLLRNYFGASDELLSTFNKMVTFDVEAVGGGAGIAPAWSPLIRSCAWSETITATERVTYKPITNSQESSSMYVYDSGVLHKFLGTRGGVSFSLGLGGIPTMSYSFLAIDGGDTAATPSGVSYTNFLQPQVVTDQFSGDLTIGATLAAPGTAPSLTGGTIYPSKGLMVDMGIKASYIPLLGGQSVEITDRKATGKITLDLTAAQEVTFNGTVTAGTLQSVGMLHGTVVGRRFGIFAPTGQLKNPQKDEQDGKRLMTYDLTFPPTSAGNDEITVVTSF